MLAKTIPLDPMQVERAEKAAEQEWGPQWRSKKLDQYFGPMIEREPDAAFDRKSYLLQAAPQMESNVLKALREAGLDGYLPMAPKSVRFGYVKRRLVMRPMLPGYVFPIFDMHRDNWKIITRPDKDGKGGIEGVVRLFLWGERPVPVPEQAVQQLHDREVEEQMRGNIKKTAAPYVAMPGSFVQIDDGGSWNGFIGEVVDMFARGRLLIVELDLFGRKTPVEVPVHQVIAI